MVLHKHNNYADGFMNGPQDGATWRPVYDRFPYFSDDPRHVRLAISMNGVNPYNQLHSTWPITYVILNFPPWLSIKSVHIMLSTIVHGVQKLNKHFSIYVECNNLYTHLIVPNNFGKR